jgi:alkylation response protein AidB-like acyl-CoA dehydrogenase
MNRITSPDSPELDALCARLRAYAASPESEAGDAWPADTLAWCGEAGVYEWFLPREWGGQDWSDADIIRGYLKLSTACLTTAFIITQRSGACRRIAGAVNQELAARLLPDLVSGKAFATVGISHLTTSRRHVARPVLAAEATSNGFVLDGFSPWVTGALHASTIVTGATLPDGRQILVALPTDSAGVTVPPPVKLVGLSGSATGEVRCDRVQLGREWLLAGPSPNVMNLGTGAGTGGLQTSTLALGLATAAVDFLEGESGPRAELSDVVAELRHAQQELTTQLLALAAGEKVCSQDDFRARANSFVLRSTQAALSAAKGSGYVYSHPVGRWCREALFFLVWSCPAGVMRANLCELAGLAD